MLDELNNQKNETKKAELHKSLPKIKALKNTNGMKNVSGGAASYGSYGTQSDSALKSYSQPTA